MMLRITRATVAKKPGHREITKETVKTIAQGRPGVSGVPVVTNACAFYTPHAAAGATGTRLSLHPLLARDMLDAQLGRVAPRES